MINCKQYKVALYKLYKLKTNIMKKYASFKSSRLCKKKICLIKLCLLALQLSCDITANAIFQIQIGQ